MIHAKGAQMRYLTPEGTDVIDINALEVQNVCLKRFFKKDRTQGFESAFTAQLHKALDEDIFANDKDLTNVIFIVGESANLPYIAELVEKMALRYLSKQKNCRLTVNLASEPDTAIWRGASMKVADQKSLQQYKASCCTKGNFQKEKKGDYRK